MITIIDYGMGNLRSVEKAFRAIGFEAEITYDPERVRRARKLVLPGVGAFRDAMANLRERRLMDAIYEAVKRGTPTLGLCLGMQLLFSESEEFGHHAGLDIFKGKVLRFESGLRVPHIGWNQIQIMRKDPILAGIPEGAFFYFVHSYYVEPEDESLIIARTEYGQSFASIIGRDHIWGAQFHPEKSQHNGLQLLGNFALI